MSESPTLSASQEDYLEAILRLLNQKQVARVRDIAGLLGVRAPSVTGALQALAERGLVTYAPYENATLTAAGHSRAAEVARRHAVLREFLLGVLGIAANEADAAACRIEHVISGEVADRLVQFLEFVRGDDADVSAVRARFAEFCRRHSAEACAAELSARLEQPAAPAELVASASLRDIPPGGRCTVVKVGGASALRKRIMDLGLMPGAPVRVCRVAPLGDPIEVETRGCHLSLRKAEAATISVAPT